MNQLLFMGRHEVFPVKLHGTREELVLSFLRYVNYREDVEKCTPSAMRGDYKAIKTLGKFRGIPNEVWPRAPQIVEEPRELEQSPEDIHALLHAKWVPNARNSYTQHLIQYLLVYDFGYGPRMPSEAWSLKWADFDPKRHLITITETKKGGRRRRLVIDPEWLCCSPTHPSLANYFPWRQKVDPEWKQEAFFLKPDGTPFPSAEAIKQFLEGYIQEQFPWFHGYLGRTWFVNAQLVRTDGDYATVADMIGHTSVETLRKFYEKDWRVHRKLYGDQWFERAFRKPKTKKGGRTIKGGKTAYRPPSPSGTKMLPAGSAGDFSLSRRTIKRGFSGLSSADLSRDQDGSGPSLSPSSSRGWLIAYV